MHRHVGEDHPRGALGRRRRRRLAADEPDQDEEDDPPAPHHSRQNLLHVPGRHLRPAVVEAHLAPDVDVVAFPLVRGEELQLRLGEGHQLEVVAQVVAQGEEPGRLLPAHLLGGAEDGDHLPLHRLELLHRPVDPQLHVARVVGVGLLVVRQGVGPAPPPLQARGVVGVVLLLGVPDPQVLGPGLGLGLAKRRVEARQPPVLDEVRRHPRAHRRQVVVHPVAVLLGEHVDQVPVVVAVLAVEAVVLQAHVVDALEELLRPLHRGHAHGRPGLHRPAGAADLLVVGGEVPVRHLLAPFVVVDLLGVDAQEAQGVIETDHPDGVPVEDRVLRREGEGPQEEVGADLVAGGRRGRVGEGRGERRREQQHGEGQGQAMDRRCAGSHDPRMAPPTPSPQPAALA